MTDESIFAAALAIGSPADRAAYLDRACAGNPALRREVEELLAAHGVSNPLDRPPADLARTGAYEPEGGPPPAAVGDRVGPYRLMEQIGEGGFGLVFVAEQAEPVRRRVALKVLKPGMDTRDVVARFEAERQALALMDHPHIAKVLDAGSTPQGRPYFVMELIRGVPVTDYCDQHRLPPRDRLALFVQVCQAVQHAHQKGVIHRDIKPSNVLVTVIDGAAVPKVIDFGVAKAVGQSLTEKTIYTRFAQMVGTPLYMSPEQAAMSGVDVDTRADVYALGVMLYELLTGTTPFDRDRFRKAAFDEIRRIIREEDPPRPSTRLTSLGATLTAVSASRGTDPGRLAGLVRGELDWIVMRCLEKDRGRRYDTAAGLARDVQRYLSGDAVEACPPTAGYRLRKAYRRNRAAVWLTAAFAGLVAGAAVMGAVLAVQARLAEGEAARERDEAEAERVRATESERRVRGLLAESEALRRRDELRLASADVDRDLKLFESGDIQLGLVRLADTLRRLPPHAHELREFVAMALIARGQEMAPLVPPVLPAGQTADWGAVTPDGRTLVTATPVGALWDAGTGRLLRRLQEADEPAGHGALSRDGRLAVTLARDGVARFWDVPSGRLRAKTRPITDFDRSHPEDRRKWLLLSDDGRRFLLALPDPRSHDRYSVTVWDTGTGRATADLTAAGVRLRAVALSPDGRQVMTAGVRLPYRLWSADGGALVKEFFKSETESQDVAFSPSGRRLSLRDGFTVRMWDLARPTSFREVRLDSNPPGWEFGTLRYISEDVAVYPYSTGRTTRLMVLGHDERHAGGTPEVQEADLYTGRFWIDGDLLGVGTRVYDLRRRREQWPLPGRVFHPALDRFAHDGRWFVTERGVYDLITGKHLVVPGGRSAVVLVPGVGFVGAGHYEWDWENVGSMVPVWVPLPGRLPSDDLLVLWAQVVARGELGADGDLRKWDEATWDRKRQELAAQPAPFPDVPFPGRVAADRLHWLRYTTYSGDIGDGGWLGLYQRLAERAAAGDPDEAAFWQRRVREENEERASKVAPPPRPAKP